MTINQPPLPPLQADIENLVFSHKGLFSRPTNTIDDSEDPRDWERVAFLGEGILLAAMSKVLYYAYPRRRTNALNPTRRGMLSKEELASITDSYRLMDRLKCLESSRSDITKSLDNRAALAESFVGGLALQYGMEQANQWTEQMLAWKHDLPVPIGDEESLGIRESTTVNGGKEVVTKDFSGDSSSEMPGATKDGRARSPLPSASLSDASPFPPTARSARPTQTPRDRTQNKPPQEVLNLMMQFQIPVQEPTFNPTMYQAGTATKSTVYNASSFYPISSSHTPPQPVPGTDPPSSPPAAVPVPKPPQAVPQPQIQTSAENISV
ncbi:hypothetical protein FS837_002007 [Tulasnella sp. UAMH 9824]|nr:hypothetical protein FS837_002007 [Tulasnella sp. UAMH 9824]